MDVFDAIKKRRSIRRYSEKHVSDSEVKKLLTAAMYSPSAHNSRHWHFVVVKDLEKKAKLARATPWAGFVGKAPVVILICGEENASREWIEDCSIAAHNIVLEAVELGLGSCYVQVRGHKGSSAGQDSEEYLRDLFGIPDNMRVLFVLPIGYPAEDKSEHSDGEFEEDKIHFDKW